MNENSILVVSGFAKHIHRLLAGIVIGLFTSSSVCAADDTSTFLNLGVPSLVWLWAFFALVFSVILLQNKLIKQPKKNCADNKTLASTAAEKTASEDPTEGQEVDVPPFTEATAALTEAEANKEIATIHETEKEIQPEELVQPDALDEAKKLLAQQRFPQAVGTLHKGLQKNPDRSDLMLQLLDIYVKQEDVEAFEIQFEQLKRLDDPFTLIQAEELYSQLTRATTVEKSDAIEFSINSAVALEPEPKRTTQDHPVADLEFTLEKNQINEIITETQVDTLTTQNQTNDLDTEIQSIPLEQPAIAAIENDLSLDDIAALGKENHTDVKENLSLNDFDFSELGLEIPETYKFEAVEPVTSDVTPAIEPENKTLANQSTKAPVLDLDFDFDDSFAIDDDTQESTASEKAEWTTDLADENFASADTTPVVVQKLGELVKSDRLSALEEEFPFLQSVDIFQTRLDLARSYMILGEIDSARELLNEVAEEGAGVQQTEARELIAQLAS